MPIGEFSPQPNLSALYHLSDTVDNSGNNYNFTNVNSVSFSPYGKFGVCADFGTTNTNKRLTVLNDLGITGGPITVGFWLRLNTEISSGTYKFFTQGDASTFVDYQIAYEYNSGARRLQYRRVRRGSGVSATVTYPITLGISNWYFFTLTYDSTNLRGYVNGGLVGTDAGSGNGISNTIDEFTIGADFSDGNAADFSSCRMDEVFVFNRALSQQEIARYYQWSLGRFAQTL